MITNENKFKLIGFGVRKKGPREIIKGIQTYMAPEISEGSAFDEKADIWSFGVILHYLATEKYPFVTKALFGKKA